MAQLAARAGPLEAVDAAQAGDSGLWMEVFGIVFLLL